MHIYIEREREGERDRDIFLVTSSANQNGLKTTKC